MRRRAPPLLREVVLHRLPLAVGEQTVERDRLGDVAHPATAVVVVVAAHFRPERRRHRRVRGALALVVFDVLLQREDAHALRRGHKIRRFLHAVLVDVPQGVELRGGDVAFHVSRSVGADAGVATISPEEAEEFDA